MKGFVRDVLFSNRYSRGLYLILRDMKNLILRGMKSCLFDNEFMRSRSLEKKFISVNKYSPNFKEPKTFNEKINNRKLNPLNSLFSICSCKIEAKEYVSRLVSENIIIENYFVGESITFERLKEIIKDKGDCILKANHDSGQVYLLTADSTDSQISAACDAASSRLKIDYGKNLNEPWYSKIKPGLLVEKRLPSEEDGTDLRDYKFHVFKQNDGSVKIVLHVDFDRNSNHSRSYFDGDLNWLPFSVKYPSIITTINKPKNYELMLNIAKILAEPFSYVRVDLYNVDGEIYFGEMTFSPGSGLSEFSAYAYDLWMGNMWHGDPRY